MRMIDMNYLVTLVDCHIYTLLMRILMETKLFSL